ncbi:MAG: hypothetical protein Q3M24_02185 [Candidatus Electrothrix aestuarii]|uniref:Uncharacterized protein n=1 Tax=Candidatus Electrothrix aestuarii TaxID=3062594 RepID=A0AAU8LWC5_9BACT|nr:hypothetical protein [Candidatus Electrothrix aestuarii]MDU9047196.1 hypothetical protein [Candidatus Electrothrix aestuarii]
MTGDEDDKERLSCCGNKKIDLQKISVFFLTFIINPAYTFQYDSERKTSDILPDTFAEKHSLALLHQRQLCDQTGGDQ